jgi:hypothetical protein
MFFFIYPIHPISALNPTRGYAFPIISSLRIFEVGKMGERS